MTAYRFPSKFVWGVATSAPQIEGAACADGKGPSIWDGFCQRPGAIRHGDTLDDACDHYRRFDADFALMRRLGIRHYRMSVAWPRLLPEGDGAVNRAGVDFYHRVFDSLERHGITPWVTMYHWDLPQALEGAGGWRSRGVVAAFARFADLLVRSYGDRVKHWITINEIFCFTRLGYGTGEKAPGVQEGEAVVNQAYHHALLSHGHGVRAVREHGGRGARVGLTDNAVVTVPVDRSPANVAAARKAFVSENLRVLDAVMRGRYAPAYRRAAGRAAARVERGDFALIAAPMDFLGLNVYTGKYVRAGSSGEPETVPFPAGFPRADCPWLHFVPEALYWGPRLVDEVYGPLPLYITEHGAGFNDPAQVRGEFADLHRREFLRAYLRELHRAVAEGVPVKGYFLWSFLDNFEWDDGYERRFGIVHTDFRTQRRTPKLSARWYSEVIRRNALS